MAFVPGEGLDNAWITELSVLSIQGARWGRDIVFTYGPLGFVVNPTLLSGRLLAISFAARLMVLAVIFVALLTSSVAAALTRRWPVAVAAAVFALLSWTQPYVPEATFGAFLLAHARFRSAQRVLDSRATRRWMAVCVALTVLLFLSKVNFGVFALLVQFVGVLGICAARRNIRVAKSAGAGVLASILAIPLAWVLLGQSVRDFGPFVRGSLSVAAGFGQNMGTAPVSENWTIFPVVLCAVAALVAVLSVLTHSDGEARITEIAVYLLVVYLAIRSGIARQDSGHVATLIGTTVAATVALALGVAGSPSEDHIRSTSSWRPSRLLVLSVALLPFGLAVSGTKVSTVLDFGDTTRSFLKDAEFMVSGQSRHQLLLAARSGFPSGPPAQMLLSRHAVPQGERVAVEPIDVNLQWALRLGFANPPVLQRYAAFNTLLDGLNAGFYAGPKAPRWILYKPGFAIDGRSAVLESPRTFKAIYCSYDSIDSEGSWHLLARRANRGCHKRQGGGRSVSCATTVRLASPRRTLSERLRALLVRPRVTTARLGSNHLRVRLTEASFSVDALVALAPGSRPFPDLASPDTVLPIEYDQKSFVASGTVCKS